MAWRLQFHAWRGRSVAFAPCNRTIATGKLILRSLCHPSHEPSARSRMVFVDLRVRSWRWRAWPGRGELRGFPKFTGHRDIGEQRQ